MKKKIIYFFIMCFVVALFFQLYVSAEDVVQKPNEDYSYYVDNNYKLMSAGSKHTIVVTHNNEVFTWGANEFGELGNGSLVAGYEPNNITDYFSLQQDEEVELVRAGYLFSYLLTTHGRVFSWGYNMYGQLGSGDIINKLVPTEITNNFPLSIDEKITDIKLGQSFVLALTSNGNLYTWGQNGDGQLGNNSYDDSVVPINITSNFPLTSQEKIINIDAGSSHAVALTSENNLFSWGDNFSGQLGDGTNISKSSPINITSHLNLDINDYIVDIELGSLHSTVLTNDGQVFSWGKNYSGQLGDGNDVDRNTPFNITDIFSLYNEESEEIRNIYVGDTHSLAITSLERVFAWGNNSNGQLGNGNQVSYYYPIEITDSYGFSRGISIDKVSLGGAFSTVITSDDNLYVWGQNTQNQLGIYDIDLINYPTKYLFNEVQVNTPEGVLSEAFMKVSTGYNFSVGLTNTNKVFTWGNNSGYELGDGTTNDSHTPIDITNYFSLPENEIIVDIVAGRNFGLALTSENQIYGWGSNGNSQLANNINFYESVPVNLKGFLNLQQDENVQSIFADIYNGAVVTTLGRVLVWGDNQNQQLFAYEESTNENKFVSTPLDITNGLDLSTDEEVISVNFGNTFMLVLSSNGNLYSRGKNSSGQLGDGTITDRDEFSNIEDFFNLSETDKIIEVKAGLSSALALTLEGNIYTWGSNTDGRLGTGDYSTVLEYSSLPINIKNQINLESSELIVGIETGYDYKGIYTNQGKVYTWGRNYFYTLGDGSHITQYAPVEITDNFDLNQGDIFIGMSFNYNHSSAVTSTGKLFLWGNNSDGKLGDGTTLTKVTPMEINPLNSSYNNILMTYTNPNFNHLKSELKISIIPEYEISDSILGFFINGDLYTNFTIVNGKIDLYIPNTWQVGDSLVFELESVKFTNEVIIDLEGQTITQTKVTSDTTDPIITYNYEYDLFVEKGIDASSYLQAEVKDDSQEVLEIVLTNNVDWNTPGTYVVGYYSVDSSGNEVTRSRSVVILPEIITDLETHELMTFSGFADEVYGESQQVKNQTIVYYGLTYESVNEYTENDYQVFDNNLIFEFEVEHKYVVASKSLYYPDTEAPTFEVSNQTIEVNDYIDIDWTTYIENAQDNSNQALTYTEVIDNVDYSSLGTYSVTVKVADSSGNETSKSFNVTVDDSTPPSFDIYDQTIESGDFVDVDWTSYMVNKFDNYSVDLTASEVTDNVDYDTPGTYQVTVILEDAYGNSISKSFSVVVEDTTVPTFESMVGDTIEVNEYTDIDWTSRFSSITDNSDTEISIIEVSDYVDYSRVGWYMVTLEISDAYGNSGLMNVQVGVEDTISPTFDLSEDMTFEVGSVSNLSWASYITNIADNSNGEVLIEITYDSLDFNRIGVYKVLYMAIDESFNIRKAYLTINIVDTQAPVITLTGADTVYVEYEDIYNDSGATCLDNYDTSCAVTMTSTLDTSVLGTYTITYTATDSSGNQSSITRSVIVQDTTWPEIRLDEEVVYVEYNSEYIDSGITCTDNYDGNCDIISVGEVDTSVLGWYQIEYNAVDTSGNNANPWSRSVYVVDSTPPTFDISDQTIEVDTLNIDWSTYISNASDNYSTVLTLTEVCDLVDYNTIGNYEVTVSVEDEEGNINEKTITVTVVDSEAPVITLTGDETLFIEYLDTYTEPGATCIDNYDETCALTVSQSIDTSALNTYIVTYSTIDSSGNEANITRTVIIQDTTKPTITLIGDSEITLEVGNLYIEQGAIYSDNYGVDENITITGDVDSSTVGTYLVTYNLRDMEGNVADTVIRTVYIVDTTNPIIEVEDQVFEVGNQYFDWSTFITYANDNYSTELDFTIADGDLDYFTVGAYEVVIYASDEAGNTASGTLTVNIVDTQLPLITLIGNETVYLEYQASYVEEGATCTDNYDTTCEVSITGAVDSNELGTYMITYTATDTSGNQTSMKRTVIVQDTTKPIITLIGDDEITLEVETDYLEQGALYTDNFGVNENIAVSGIVNTSLVGTYTIYYDITDMEGNMADTVTRTVHIVDTSSPTFDIDDQIIEVGSSDVDWTTYIENINDNYSTTFTLLEVNDFVDYDVLGDYEVQVAVNDEFGNNTLKTIKVQVIDTQAPVISLIGDETVYLEYGESYIDEGTTCIDNYDTNCQVYISGIVDQTTLGSYTITYKAIDSSGNYASEITRQVIVQDSVGPEIKLENESIYVEYNTEFTDSGVSCTDNYDEICEITSSGVVDTSILGSYIIDYNATDSNGNMANLRSVTVYVVDTTKPTFDISDQTIEIGSADIDWTTYISNENDNYSTELTLTEVSDIVDYNSLGDYEVSVSVSDEFGNIEEKTIIVTVVDTTKPVIHLNGDQEITIELGSEYKELGASFTDNYGVNENMVISGSVDTNTVGSYNITYDISDLSGNVADTVTRVIHVVDTKSPILDYIGEEEIYIEYNDIYIEQGVTCLDESTCDITIGGDSVDTMTLGTYRVEYNGVDSEGNQAKTIYRDVHVVDTTKPTFTIENQTIEVTKHMDIDWTTYINNASDNYSETLTMSEVIDKVDYHKIGTYEVILSVSDEAGNTLTKTLMVEVKDLQAPIIYINGPDVIYLEVGSKYIEQGATYVDDYGVKDTIVIEGEVDTSKTGVYTVTYDIKDLAGNQAETITRTIYVQDTIAPSFEIEDQIIEVGSQQIDWTSFIKNASDNYSSTLIYSQIDSVEYHQVGTYQVTLIVKDEADNRSEQIIEVTVKDSQAPTFDDIEDQTIEAGSDEVDWTTYIKNVKDNYSQTLTLSEEDQVDYHTVGSYEVIVSVSDEYDNQTSKTFTVHIVDTISPRFNVEDQVVEAGIEDVDWTRYITNANDNSSGDLTYIEVEDNVIYDTPGTYTVIVKVIDQSNNETEKTLNVEVIDTTPPTYNITIEAGLEDIDWTDYITDLNDNAIGDLSVSEISDDVDYNTPGTYAVLLSVIDASLNEQVTKLNIRVQDTIQPQVSLNPSLDSIEEGKTYKEYGVDAIDVTDTTYTIEGQVDTSIPGIYELTYIVKDTSGNETRVKRFVTVYEKESKLEFVLGQAQTTLLIGDTYEDGSCQVLIDGERFTCDLKEENVNTNKAGLYYVIYAYSYKGKEYTYTRFIFVLESYNDIEAYLPLMKEDDEQ
ncbi:DUF5011 domain-containing protein [Mycoplasmatota bacterium]|nr:DUF5011 domain-containing protein [Mycoplasmatota bacterium]